MSVFVSAGHKFYEWKRLQLQQKRISDGRWGCQGSVGGENENCMICHHRIKKISEGQCDVGGSI